MPKLPILMYHSVTKDSSKSQGLVIDQAKLEAQFAYLVHNNYTTLHFKDISNNNSIPEKSIIITFDDVYINQLELAYPLLEKYKLKACFYIPFKYVGGINDWDKGQEPIMSLEQLKHLDPNIVELGWHSYAHGNYKELSDEATKDDFELCRQYIDNNNLNVHHTLAYPYGKYPKEKLKQVAFFETLKANNIQFGLRIGNRVNNYPFRNPHEIQRIDIKGEDSLGTFKRKLKYGKLRLF